MRRWCDGGAGGWRRGWNALMVGRAYIPDAVAGCGHDKTVVVSAFRWNFKNNAILKFRCAIP